MNVFFPPKNSMFHMFCGILYKLVCLSLILLTCVYITITNADCHLVALIGRIIMPYAAWNVPVRTLLPHTR